MFNHNHDHESSDKIGKYIEEIQRLIVSLLFKSKDFQQIKKKMLEEGIEIQEGIFAFMTKEVGSRRGIDAIEAFEEELTPVVFEVTQEDKELLNDWGIKL